MSNSLSKFETDTKRAERLLNEAVRLVKEAEHYVEKADYPHLNHVFKLIAVVN